VAAVKRVLVVRTGRPSAAVAVRVRRLRRRGRRVSRVLAHPPRGMAPSDPGV